MEGNKVIYRSGDDLMINSLLVADWLVSVVKHYKFNNSNHTPAKIVLYVPKDFGGIPIQILQEGTDDTSRPFRASGNTKSAKPVRAVPSPKSEPDAEE